MVSNNWGLVGQPRWLSPCQSIEFEGCPWQWFLVLRTAPENDYGQRLPHCALVEIIFLLEEVATVYRAWSSGASACRNPSKPEFCFKNLGFFLFSFLFQCTELECSLLLFSTMLTAVPPYLKLYFRVPLTCSVLYLLLTVDPLQFHTQNLLRKLLSYHFSPAHVQSKGMTLRWVPCQC